MLDSINKDGKNDHYVQKIKQTIEQFKKEIDDITKYCQEIEVQMKFRSSKSLMEGLHDYNTSYMSIKSL